MMFGVTQERDPALMALEKNTFNILKEISEKDDALLGIIPSPSFGNPNAVVSLSVEDAIKELISMQNQNKI